MENQFQLTRRGRLLTLIIGAVIWGIIILAIISGTIEKWLWMKQLDYTAIFWTLFSVKWLMFCLAFIVAFLYLWINLHLAIKKGAVLLEGNSAGSLNIDWESGTKVSLAGLKRAVVTISVVVALFFALIFYAQWDTYLRFRYGESFGLPDPLFGVDVGFYVFHLPFYELLQNSLTGLTLVTLLSVLMAYVYFGLRPFTRRARLQERAAGIPHLSALLFLMVASWGWGFYLDHFELLYSDLGVVHGAGYTADHVIRIALWVMVGATVALCALLLLNVFRPGFRTMVVGTGSYLALYFIAILLLPAVFQRFVVQPNELALESPYLKHNIEFTRDAYIL